MILKSQVPSLSLVPQRKRFENHSIDTHYCSHKSGSRRLFYFLLNTHKSHTLPYISDLQFLYFFFFFVFWIQFFFVFFFFWGGGGGVFVFFFFSPPPPPKKKKTPRTKY